MQNTPEPPSQKSLLPDEAEFYRKLMARHRRGKIGQVFYQVSILVAFVTLVTLFATIINEAFGTIAVQYKIDPATLAPEGQDLDDLDNTELATLLLDHVPRKLRVIIRDTLSQVSPEVFTKAPLHLMLPGGEYPPELANLTVNDLTEQEQVMLLAENLPGSALRALVLQHVAELQVIGSWSLLDTALHYGDIKAERDDKFPEAHLKFYSWLNRDFLTRPMSSTPANAGIRTALLGSFFMVVIVVMVALPMGVGAAIYLEEYAADTWINRLIETNIRNLAGVPSIIYGMLGLAVFVRALGHLTSGAMFGVTDSNGRTIFSAALTLALLVLPIIIINAQEALRSVPSSIREASYGLGATQWQTIWRQILPARLPGILTGTILAVSRALGETAPLIVVGASTYIVSDPSGPFSKFTALPIQIFQWTSRPQDQFRDSAAAAIIVLLLLLVALNGTAIVLRNRYSKRF